VTKIRVMIAAKDFLKYQVDENVPPPEFERRGHWVRWETLLQMKRHMEREEEAAAMNKKLCRKVWEVSLSFIVPYNWAQEEREAKGEFQDYLITVCEQLQAFDEGIKNGNPRMMLRGADACPWRRGSESDDLDQFPTSKSEPLGLLGRSVMDPMEDTKPLQEDHPEDENEPQVEGSRSSMSAPCGDRGDRRSLADKLLVHSSTQPYESTRSVDHPPPFGGISHQMSHTPRQRSRSRKSQGIRFMAGLL